MLSLLGGARIFVAREPVDFRRAHDGLCTIVREHFGDDPFSGDLFVFFNRRRDRIKLQVWDRQGFWLAYKRLERGTFEALSVPREQSRLAIDRVRLAALLDGVSVKDMEHREHFARAYRIRARGHDEHCATASR